MDVDDDDSEKEGLSVESENESESSLSSSSRSSSPCSSPVPPEISKRDLLLKALSDLEETLTVNGNKTLDFSEFTTTFAHLFIELTKTSEYIVNLISWKDEIESRDIFEAKRTYDSTKASQKAKKKATNSLFDDLTSSLKNNTPTHAGRFRLAAIGNDESGKTSMREAIVSLAAIEKTGLIHPDENNKKLDDFKKDKVLKDCLLSTVYGLLETFSRQVPHLSNYWSSDVLSRLVGRRKCTGANCMFLYIIIHCLVVSETIPDLESTVTGILGKYKDESIKSVYDREVEEAQRIAAIVKDGGKTGGVSGLKTSSSAKIIEKSKEAAPVLPPSHFHPTIKEFERGPVTILRFLVNFVLRDVDYGNMDHQKDIMFCFIFLCRRWMLCGTGRQGYGDMMTYQPFSQFMHFMFHTLRRFEACQVISMGTPEQSEIPNLPVLNEGSKLRIKTNLARGVLTYIKEVNYRSDRIQLFNDTIFKMFLAPGDEIGMLDISPFDTPTPIGTMDEISFSPFKDLCSLCVYLGPQKILSAAMEGEDKLRSLFDPKTTEGPITDREISLVLVTAGVFAMDVFITTLTASETQDFVETNVFYEPSCKDFECEPGTIIFMGNKFYLADIGNHLIDVENNLDILLACYNHCIKSSDSSLGYKSRVLHFFERKTK